MNMKRLTALLLCALLAGALLGCAPAGTPQSSTEPDATAQTPAGSPATPNPAGAYDTHVKISTNITDADKMGSDALYDFICEKFNMEWNRLVK